MYKEEVHPLLKVYISGGKLCPVFCKIFAMEENGCKIVSG